MPSTPRKLAVSGALASLLLFGAAACSDDDGGEVRGVEGEEGSGSGSASGSASGSGSGSESGSASGVEAECSPVGTDLEADATDTVEISLDEYAFDPAAVEVAAGTVTFEASNDGEELHELAFLPGGGDIPLTDEGEPDEDALADAGAFELEAFPAGETCNATYELEPGTYTLFCIVEAPDGETHASKGMLGELTVT